MLIKLGLNKFFNKLNLRTLYLSIGIGLFGAFSSGWVLANPPAGGATVDYSTLTNSLNFNSVMTGILAVAGGLIAVYAGMAGVKWVLRMIRGA
ncbi:major capsid protein, partial [Arsenophonus sp.]|uniref:major capsid protein n=1 Tax=Arsenophonus sp. TaxID=1872640 RepID=UPI00285CAEB7